MDVHPRSACRTHGQLSILSTIRILTEAPTWSYAAKKDLRPEGIHRRIVALDPICYLLEWVHGCRGRPCTSWLPLLVLLLINWPVRWASSICGDVKSLNSTDTELVQASLREQIFAHRPVFATMNTHLPIDLRISFADIDLGDQCAPSSL